MRLICKNKKAFYDYEILDTYEAGISLIGSEVKSCRAGRASLVDGYARIRNGEAFLCNVHISKYIFSNQEKQDPLRVRKLLLHKKELKKLTGKVKEKGLTLVPLKMYIKENRIKVELGLVKGKRLYDKREAIKARDERRLLSRALKEKHRI
ncbi:MAG: SsrA-binding protein SmpB [Thermodesulfobacteriota bacterium]|nr:SsrA-binding protein SmpB [Thermodesulfobacteriota bacterium]